MKKTPIPMTPFDEWTVPKELHTLKLLLPYIPAASQQALGILIKVMELQHTVQYFDRQKNLLHGQDISPGLASPMEMLEEISPYLPPEQAGMLETFRSMMNIMDMVQMMQLFSDDTESMSADSGGSKNSHSGSDTEAAEKGTFSADPDMSKKGASFQDPNHSGGGFNPMQLVMGMLSPEQREMFETYQTMFSRPDEPAAAESFSGGAPAAEFSSENASSAEFSSGNASAAEDHDTGQEQPEYGTVNSRIPDTETQNFETQDAQIQAPETQNAQMQDFGTQDAQMQDFETQDAQMQDFGTQNAQMQNFGTQDSQMQERIDANYE